MTPLLMSHSRKMLGAKMRQCRLAAKVRVDDAAKIINRDTGTIYRIEQGKQTPDAFQLNDLAFLYGVEMGVFFELPKF